MPQKKSPTTRTRQTKFDREFEKFGVEYKAQVSSVPALTSREKEDDTRQDVTRKFVRYYFGILIAIIAGVPLYNLAMMYIMGKPDLLIPLKDAILTYSAVVGPTFGLVVAYYFKTTKE